MQIGLEQNGNNTITEEYVVKRISDWKLRINELYDLVQETLSCKEDIQCRTDRKSSMHEEFMHQFDINPINLPILEVYKRNDLILIFKPIALWVVGANGRIDIFSRKGDFTLVDMAEYKKSPNWIVFARGSTKKNKFGPSFIVDLV